MEKEIEFSTETTIPLWMAQRFKKLILRAQIQQEMNRYADELKWEEYRDSQIIKQLQMKMWDN